MLYNETSNSWYHYSNSCSDQHCECKQRYPGNLASVVEANQQPNYLATVFKLEGASSEGQDVKPVQNSSYVTLFQAYLAVKGRPAWTRQHPYERNETELEEPNETVVPTLMKTVEEPTPPTMNIAPAIKVKKTELAITILKKKWVIVKKKKMVQLSIAVHIQSYNIVNNLQ